MNREQEAPPRVTEILPAGLLIGIGFMSSTLVTPLYALYRADYHFSEIVLTLIYAVYVVGNLVALLFFGRVSDEIGRRRIAWAALALAACSTILFILARGTVWLFAGRLLSGFGVGLASGTGTAWIADLYGKSRQPGATLAACCANLTGAAFGPLLSGVLAQYAPMPLELSFYAYLVLVFCTAFAVGRSRETIGKRESDLKRISLAPSIGVPKEARGKFIAPAVAAFGVWALAGFYFALLPGLLSQALGVKSVAIAGAIVFEMMVSALVATVVARDVKSERAMVGGLLMQIPSVAILLLAEALASMPLLLIGSAVTGTTLGFGYRGSLLVVNQLAADKRAAVVSAYFSVVFIGNSVPIIGIGVITKFSDAFLAHIVFAGTIAAFAIAAVLTRGRYSDGEKEAPQGAV